jgi:pimeloyl-ACP methyl ester carboxylesterase
MTLPQTQHPSLDDARLAQQAHADPEAFAGPYHHIQRADPGFYGILSLMNHRTISNRRGITHYWIDGVSDETIIFTHGANMDHGMFHSQTGQFAENYKVISWDVPCHGLSRSYQDFSLQHAAEDLIQILDTEHVDQAHLVGQSMGGYISQIAALKYPDRVRSLTSVDSSPIQLSYYTKLDRWLLAIHPALILFYPHKFLIKTIAAGSGLEKAVQSYALEVLETRTTSEIAFIMNHVYKGLRPYKQDHRLNCPILIVYGEKDAIRKMKEYGKQWSKRESRELKVISSAGHNANQDNPDEFNQVLETFLINL